MTPDKGLLKGRFIRATEPYIGTEEARNKHKNYLHNVMFRRASYDIQKANRYLDEGKLDLLFEELWAAICEVFAAEEEKAQRMIAEDSFTLSASNGEIVIGSESSSTTYKVNLAEGTCSCPHGRKLSYVGLMCKHVMSVYTLMPHVIAQPEISLPAPKRRNRGGTGVRRLNID